MTEHPTVEEIARAKRDLSLYPGSYGPIAKAQDMLDQFAELIRDRAQSQGGEDSRSDAQWLSDETKVYAPVPADLEAVELIESLKEWLERTRDERNFPAHLFGWCEEADARLDAILSALSPAPGGRKGRRPAL